MMSAPAAVSCKNLALRSAVKVSVHARPFEKLARGDHLFESVAADKEILAAIDFFQTWRTSRVRDRIAKILDNFQHVLE